MHLISLAILLFGFWLLLSGHFTAWLVGAGVVCAFAVALAGRRIGYADEEGHPVSRLLAGLIYWPWLLKEIVLSTWQVARLVVAPRPAIRPQLLRVNYSQTSAVGIATYANSITLTPGTITVDVDSRKREFLVHALTDGGAEGLEGGDMDRRVRIFEGRR